MICGSVMICGSSVVDELFFIISFVDVRVCLGSGSVVVIASDVDGLLVTLPVDGAFVVTFSGASVLPFAASIVDALV